MSTVPLDTPAVLKTAKSEAGRMMIAGFALAILGMFAIASPLIVGVSVALLVGILLTTGGLGQVFFAVQSYTGTKRVVYFLFGGLSILCGVMMISQPMFRLQFMTVLLVTFFLLSGVAEMFHALQLRPVKGWAGLLASGLISLLLAVFIWQGWPLSGAWATGVLVGVKLLVCGIALAVLGIAARTMIREEQARL